MVLDGTRGRAMIKYFFSACILLQVGLFSNYAVADEDICQCVNEPINTDAKARSCKKLLDVMTPEETVRITGECKAKLVGESKLDVCYCLKTFHSDPDIVKACEKIIGKEAKPSEMARMAADCK